MSVIKLLLAIYCLLETFTYASSKGVIIYRHQISDRIINGQNATIDEVPYIVQIVEKYDLGDENFICAGTVISDRYILSAAHCFKSYVSDDLAVVANATYLIGSEGPVQRDVEALFKHPQYKKDPTDYDVAVLKLKDPLPLDLPGIKVMKMCNKSWKNGGTIQVSGWGRTKEKAITNSNQLQTVFLTTMGPKRCKKIFDELTPRMSCVLVTKGRDACQCDSGGPAIYNGELCGIVSFGSFGCGRDNTPSIFTNIPAVMDFIKSSMLK